MSTSALGIKRHCHACDTKFYDLNKFPIVCPKCNTVFDPEVLLKSRRIKPVAQQPAAVAANEDPAPAEDIDSDIKDVSDDISDDVDVLEDEADLIPVTAEGGDDDNAIASDDATIEGDLDAIDGDEAEE